MKKFIYCAVPLFGVLMGACEKFLTIAPPNDRLDRYAVFTDSASAASAIIGFYSDLTSGTVGPLAAQNRLAGLSTQELEYTGSSDVLLQFYRNALSPDNSEIRSLWSRTYRHIYQINAIIEGVVASVTLSMSAKEAIKGEAMFLRAFLYFYAVNNWGDIPLILGTDYEANERASRIEKNLVFDQIVSDLEAARLALPIDYPTPERLRPNRSAAEALLARAKLFMGDWKGAAELASVLIESSGRYEIEAMDSVFLKGSTETIWQLFLASQISSRWTLDGYYFVPSSLTNSSIPTYLVSGDLYGSFEDQDKRKSAWIAEKAEVPYYFPYKYKIRSGPAGVSPEEYTIVFRLAEQYLIRAEARVHLADHSGAIEDLNVIRRRAGLSELENTFNEDQLLLLVDTERRHELFCEWGHRWFDQKRTNRAPKPSLWPIPQDQRLINANLSQNDGY